MNVKNLKPNDLRRLLGLYGPYLGAGVRVTYIAEDWRELHVELRLRWYNINAVGSHFGGSLYAMVDPHLMLLLMKLLGPEYYVWDKAAGIEFVKPGKGTVRAVIKLSDDEVEEIRRATSGGEKYLPEFDLKVVDEEGEVVARVHKVLYVRRKEHGAPVGEGV